MFIIWIFIIAIVAIVVIYLVSNKSCCCGKSGADETPFPKTVSPEVSPPAAPAEDKTSEWKKPAGPPPSSGQ